MNDRILIDTNLLVYSYEKFPSDDKKCGVCRDIVLDCFRGKIKLAVSNQILAEFFHVITSKSEYPLDRVEAQRLILLIVASSRWSKVNYTAHTVVKAMEFSSRFGVSVWDSIIAATMIENNIFTLYTENEKDFLKIPGIRVINPLKASI